MKHFVLIYDYVADYLEKRAPHRPVHLEHARAAVARQELELGGAFKDEPTGLLVFKAETAATAEAFAAGDPYVIYGVVSSWRVREWTTVVGPGALTKV